MNFKKLFFPVIALSVIYYIVLYVFWPSIVAHNNREELSDSILEVVSNPDEVLPVDTLTKNSVWIDKAQNTDTIVPPSTELDKKAMFLTKTFVNPKMLMLDEYFDLTPEQRKRINDVIVNIQYQKNRTLFIRSSQGKSITPSSASHIVLDGKIFLQMVDSVSSAHNIPLWSLKRDKSYGVKQADRIAKACGFTDEKRVVLMGVEQYRYKYLRKINRDNLEEFVKMDEAYDRYLKKNFEIHEVRGIKFKFFKENAILKAKNMVRLLPNVKPKMKPKLLEAYTNLYIEYNEIQYYYSGQKNGVKRIKKTNELMARFNEGFQKLITESMH